MSDTHFISGSFYYSSISGPLVLTAQDTQWDSDSFSAQGTQSSQGENFSFVSIESQYGSEVMSANDAGQYNILATTTACQLVMSYGSEWIAGTSQSYSWNETTTAANMLTDSGSSTTYYQGGTHSQSETIVTPFSYSGCGSWTYGYVVTGPPLDRVTEPPWYSGSSSGSTPPGIPLALDLSVNFSSGLGYVEAVAANAGGTPPNTALHLGTSPGGLNTSAGLVSALGGIAAHPMQFTGGEMGAELSSGSSALVIEESFLSGETPTLWVSHPSGIGYRRPSPGFSGSGSGSPTPGNVPTMDGGTDDGSQGEEVIRLANYMSGSTENPNANQSAPTPVAEQRTTGSANPTGSNNEPASSGSQGPANPPPAPGTDAYYKVHPEFGRPDGGPSPSPPNPAAAQPAGGGDNGNVPSETPASPANPPSQQPAPGGDNGSAQPSSAGGSNGNANKWPWWAGAKAFGRVSGQYRWCAV